jgi:hypothetical protein
MKTLLAIVLLAAATLTFGATVTPISTAAVAGTPQTWCGATVCPPKKQNQTPCGRQQKQFPSFGKSR